MSNAILVNPEQAQRALAICWKAHVPVNLVGAPGVGKTSAVEQFVERVRKTDPTFGYWPVILAMKGTEDFGLPAPDGGRLKYLFPPDMPLGDPTAKGIVFLDEWDRCPDPAVQNAAMQLTLGGHFHGTVMSDKVFVILAMNGTSDIHTSPVSEAARTRMVHLYVGTGAPGYWDSWSAWASGNVPDSVAGFVTSRADLLKKEEEFEELSAFNPRTGGSLLSKLVETMAETKIRHDDIRIPLYAGAIGRAAALEFTAHEKICGELPSMKDVLTSPTTAHVPEKAGSLYAMAMRLSRHTYTNSSLRKALSYIVRWPDEPAAFAAMVMRRQHPEAVTLPEFSRWATTDLS